MNEQTPAEIIQQARRKAERVLMAVCAEEINRICETFAHETGLAVGNVSFQFMDVTTLGDKRKKSILSGVSIEHEDA